jgi:putative ABC transport system ATP-binding protein
MKLFELQDVSRSYGASNREVRALNGVSLSIPGGEMLALAGPSGSGKTTLLNLLGLLDLPQGGRLCFEERNTALMTERQRASIRRCRLAFVFQTLNLIPVLTAYENVEYFLVKQGPTNGSARKCALEALEWAGVAAQAHRRVSDLSGGEKQRVAVARAIARNVDVILADEPTAALDQKTAGQIIELLRGLNRQRGTTVVFTSHDPHMLAHADRVIFLSDGRIQFQ